MKQNYVHVSIWTGLLVAMGGCLATAETDTDRAERRADTDDLDGDGVPDIFDNCPATPNRDQASCDGDMFGDACDALNARYVEVGPEQTCMTDKDDHVVYFTIEQHVQFIERDASTCGAPDRLGTRIRDSADCFNISDEECCRLLTASLSATGASPEPWCTSLLNQNRCH